MWDREQRSTASNSETMRAARVKELQEIANLRSHCTTIAGDVSKANFGAGERAESSGARGHCQHEITDQLGRSRGRHLRHV